MRGHHHGARPGDDATCVLAPSRSDSTVRSGGGSPRLGTADRCGQCDREFATHPGVRHDPYTMTELADAPEAAAPHPLRHVAFLAAVVAVALLVVGTIGPPLFGRGSLLATDMSTLGYPWRAYDEPGELNTGDHGPVTDTVDASYPTRVAVADAARDGNVFGWNPFISGGAPAASESASGSLDPFGLLFIVLPGWFAPAAIKLVQMAVAIGFTFLFGRRIGLGRVPAVFAGAAFAGSAFLVMWTNWPQPEIAALIAPLFWATERYLQGPSATRAVPIAVVVAMMLLGNFPAVVGYALYALVGYVALRLLFDADQPLRRRVVVGGGAGTSLVVGALLVAVVMIPFATRASATSTSSPASSRAAATSGWARS